VEGNYSTVDEDMPKTSKNRISMDGDYSTVELDEHLDTNCSYPERLVSLFIQDNLGFGLIVGFCFPFVCP
jgi:hypothetical protein